MNGTTGNITPPSAILRVAVGSSNPSKLNAVRQALRSCIERKEKKNPQDFAIEVEGFNVASGVTNQPMGDEETCQGAKNRAQAAYNAFKKKYKQNPHFAIGMEGGVEWVNVGKKDHKDLFCMAWMAVLGKRQAFTVDLFASDETSTYFGDKKAYFGLAKTACFPLPPKITTLVSEDGMELGEADDFLFKRKNSKHGNGSVGLLTDGIIDRAAYYEHAIILALVGWIRPDVYPSDYKP